jgi:hypothetical protein
MITGKMKLIADERGGTASNGSEWKVITFVIETDDKYNPDIALKAGTKLVDVIKGIKKGTQVQVEYNLKSREYQGKWYTDVEAYKVTPLSATVTNKKDSLATNDPTDLPF